MHQIANAAYFPMYQLSEREARPECLGIKDVIPLGSIGETHHEHEQSLALASKGVRSR